MTCIRKFRTSGLLIGLIISIASCRAPTPPLQFTSAHTLSIPSASAVEWKEDTLYIFGDDAPFLFVCNTYGKVLDTIRLNASTANRIPKGQKPDIESAYLKKEGGQTVLVGVGSLSGAYRHTAYSFPLNNLQQVSTDSLYKTLATEKELGTTNIEGSCRVGETTILANRLNTSNPKNSLVFFKQGEKPIIKELRLPKGKIVAGVSGLFYLEEKDLLIFTASEEDTPNAVDDGTIGESYLGLVYEFSDKAKDSIILPHSYYRLSDFSTQLKQQKIESVCGHIQKNGKLKLYLVSDNDGKQSRLFSFLLQTKR